MVLLKISFLSLVFVVANASVTPRSFQKRQSSNVDAYIKSERPIALQGILNNIGPTGPKCPGCHAGVVVASPNAVDPDYRNTWTRDASLVYKHLIDEFMRNPSASAAEGITTWISSQAKMQKLDNPSGGMLTGGLGEPKFMLDETAFTDPWGRPQRDGPALRSTAISTFANYLLSQGNKTYVTDTLWPMLKMDYDYVATTWNSNGFDLWEEIYGSSFFTIAVQHRALREGVAIARKLGHEDSAAQYEKEAAGVLCYMPAFWFPKGPYAIANMNHNQPRSGLDINTILASIHTFDPEAGCDNATFQPCSDKALANHLALVNSFRGSLYPINSGIPAGQAVSLGRYKEDVYFNGNPWYIGTFAAAQQLYYALHQWKTMGSIEVTSGSQAFFQQFLPSIETKTFNSATPEFATLIKAISNYADGFIALAQKYTPADGGLAEQYRKDDGKPLSALDLTWSYASALTAFDAREGLFSSTGWGAKGLQVPDSCQVQQSEIMFINHVVLEPGQTLFVVGSLPALKNWSVDSALRLDKFDGEGPDRYSAVVQVPSSTKFEYKYFRKNSNGQVIWESDPNRTSKSVQQGLMAQRDEWR